MKWVQIPDTVWDSANNMFNILKEDYATLDYEYYTWHEEDLTEDEYNEAYEYAKIAYDNYSDHNYEGHLELSDNRTLWDIDVFISATQYSDMVEDYIRAFEDEAGTDVWLLGRSGRHVCVDATIDNCFNLVYLQEIQQRMEKEMVELINEVYSEELEESNNRLKESVDNDIYFKLTDVLDLILPFINTQQPNALDRAEDILFELSEDEGSSKELEDIWADLNDLCVDVQDTLKDINRRIRAYINN